MAGSPTCVTLMYILWQLTGSAASEAMKELVGPLGGAVTFPLVSNVKQVDSIVWTFNTTPLVTMQPEAGTIIVTQNRNKERVSFLNGSYSLKLSELKKNDSGVYHVEIYSSSLQDPFTQDYMLHVYESIEEKKRTDIRPETPNLCPHSGENTEYDTISYPNRTIPMEDPANTLYSTVEIPKKIESPHSLLMMPDTPRLFTYENVI
uniref:SLAM family member 7 n=1 Tax=Saimiri boliviensis boliviensis TaxID=39432 RepID=A0A2K6TB13_SAIBB